MLILGFPDSSVGKESVCNTGDPGSIPGSGSSPGEGIGYPLQCSWASLVAQNVQNPPAMRETWVWSLGWKIPWRRAWKATPVFLLRESSWTEEPGWLQSMGHKESDMTERLSIAQQMHILWVSQMAHWLRIRLPSRRHRVNPWVGKIPWRRKRQPTAVFLPGNSHGQRSLAGYSPCGHRRVGHNWAIKPEHHTYVIRLCLWIYTYTDRERQESTDYKLLWMGCVILELQLYGNTQYFTFEQSAGASLCLSNQRFHLLQKRTLYSITRYPAQKGIQPTPSGFELFQSNWINPHLPKAFTRKAFSFLWDAE